MTGSSLTEWRKRLGFNRSQAANALGCHRNALAGWEAGKYPIPRYIALACAALSYGLPEHP
jgi:transcriptional regulator with XRE-family HTH domain